MNKIHIAAIIFGLIALYAMISFFRLRYYIRIGNGIADATIAYTQSPSAPTAQVLFVGDSSAVGVGASSPATSVAGLLGAEFPNIAIENIAVNGAKIADAREQLQQHPQQQYDLIIIHAGGNDIVRFVNLEDSIKNATQLLSDARNKSDNVIILHGGNIGTSHLFPIPIRWIYERRTRELRDAYMALAAENDNVEYIDIFREREDDPFAQQPVEYYAADFFHPGDAGYSEWYHLIRQTIDSLGLLPEE